jgi:hypothetical protein
MGVMKCAKGRELLSLELAVLEANLFRSSNVVCAR